MRTNINTAVANRNVIGYRQDRAIVSLQDDSCACAAQHLESRHASKRATHLSSAFKRWSWLVGMAGTGTEATLTRLAIPGPVRPTGRVTSPVVVLN